eukprot:NODE_11428_length_1287_cov_5.122414.p1 GENE.NODE_11428_length_1287_cov_5.122414~~NODE_11428_length_1287_cov_5.122414.p1  ORF type:complete len:309 (+),score=106.13 NODE_11428_length_1287_cov_5.122414:92-1018(+)
MPAATMRVPAGDDDADLDGNWLGGGGSGSEAEAAPAHKKRRIAAGTSAGAAPLLRKKKPAAGKERMRLAAVPGKEESSAKKKRKKRAARLAAARERPILRRGANAEELCSWEADALRTAWDQEAQSRRLSPLERRELEPSASWFLPCRPRLPLAKLPSKVPAISDGAIAPGVPRRAAIAVLCASAERCFEALGEVKSAWGVKPVVLATHGGGRKSDQVKRQSAALEAGAAVAIATPGRLARLAEGKLFEGCGVLVLDLARDAKGHSLLTARDARCAMLGLLKAHFATHLTAGKLRLVVCNDSASSANT